MRIEPADPSSTEVEALLTAYFDEIHDAFGYDHARGVATTPEDFVPPRGRFLVVRDDGHDADGMGGVNGRGGPDGADGAAGIDRVDRMDPAEAVARVADADDSNDDDKGDPIGCGGIRLVDPTTAEVKRMWLHPRARGRGVGRQLLSALEQTAVELGATRAVLDTNATLASALALYRRAGWQEIPPYNDNTEATHWFAKPLP